MKKVSVRDLPIRLRNEIKSILFVKRLGDKILLEFLKGEDGRFKEFYKSKKDKYIKVRDRVMKYLNITEDDLKKMIEDSQNHNSSNNKRENKTNGKTPNNQVILKIYKQGESIIFDFSTYVPIISNPIYRIIDALHVIEKYVKGNKYCLLKFTPDYKTYIIENVKYISLDEAVKTIENFIDSEFSKDLKRIIKIERKGV